MSEFNYLSVVSLFIALGGAACLMKLFEVADDLRADLVKKEVFSRNRFPKSIGNINADPKWKAHFVAYYEVSRDIWLKAALFLATALGLAVALFVIEGHAEQLKNMQVAADATMLDTARAIHVGGLVIWLTILFVSWRSAVDTKRKVCDES